MPKNAQQQINVETLKQRMQAMLNFIEDKIKEGSKVEGPFRLSGNRVNTTAIVNGTTLPNQLSARDYNDAIKQLFFPIVKTKDRKKYSRGMSGEKLKKEKEKILKNDNITARKACRSFEYETLQALIEFVNKVTSNASELKETDSKKREAAVNGFFAAAPYAIAAIQVARARGLEHLLSDDVKLCYENYITSSSLNEAEILQEEAKHAKKHKSASQSSPSNPAITSDPAQAGRHQVQEAPRRGFLDWLFGRKPRNQVAPTQEIPLNWTDNPVPAGQQSFDESSTDPLYVTVNNISNMSPQAIGGSLKSGGITVADIQKEITRLQGGGSDDSIYASVTSDDDRKRIMELEIVIAAFQRDLAHNVALGRAPEETSTDENEHYAQPLGRDDVQKSPKKDSASQPSLSLQQAHDKIRALEQKALDLSTEFSSLEEQLKVLITERSEKFPAKTETQTADDSSPTVVQKTDPVYASVKRNYSPSDAPEFKTIQAEIIKIKDLVQSKKREFERVEKERQQLAEVYGPPALPERGYRLRGVTTASSTDDLQTTAALASMTPDAIEADLKEGKITPEQIQREITRLKSSFDTTEDNYSMPRSPASADRIAALEGILVRNASSATFKVSAVHGPGDSPPPQLTTRYPPPRAVPPSVTQQETLMKDTVKISVLQNDGKLLSLDACLKAALPENREACEAIKQITIPVYLFVRSKKELDTPEKYTAHIQNNIDKLKEFLRKMPNLEKVELDKTSIKGVATAYAKERDQFVKQIKGIVLGIELDAEKRRKAGVRPK